MKKFKITFVVAYGKGTVEVHGGSIVNNGTPAQGKGRYSCVHTSGGTNSDGAKNRTITNCIHIHLDDSSDSQSGDAGKGAIKVPAGVTLVVDKPEYLKWDKGGDGLVFYPSKK